MPAHSMSWLYLLRLRYGNIPVIQWCGRYQNTDDPQRVWVLDVPDTTGVYTGHCPEVWTRRGVLGYLYSRERHCHSGDTNFQAGQMENSESVKNGTKNVCLKSDNHA